MRITKVTLYFLPILARVPYRFGSESLSEVVCARVCIRVQQLGGEVAEGWGETPLNVPWVWPSELPHRNREAALQDFCRHLVAAWGIWHMEGHPLEIGHEFQERILPNLHTEYNQGRAATDCLPWLAALVCCSPFDLALYDAFGKLVEKPVFETLGREWLTRDLQSYFSRDDQPASSFYGKYPSDYLRPRLNQLPVWHSVGALDALSASDLNGSEPRDGYPVLLEDWIQRDGIQCLKIKLCGTDADWDRQRLEKIGRIAKATGVRWVCADYNCTALSVEYVTDMLDQLMADDPEFYGKLLYVEQPFPYDIEAHPFDVHAIAARKPLFMDESAHDWKMIRRGRALGWNNVALKTCKTFTGALLSLCWARAHGMTLMVQDLTNPMLAQITHALLAAHAGTIMGVECNAAQFYPDASLPEAGVHPNLFRRQNGIIDISSIRGDGFGYRIDEISRILPHPDTESS